MERTVNATAAIFPRLLDAARAALAAILALTVLSMVRSFLPAYKAHGRAVRGVGKWFRGVSPGTCRVRTGRRPAQ